MLTRTMTLTHRKHVNEVEDWRCSAIVRPQTTPLPAVALAIGEQDSRYHSACLTLGRPLEQRMGYGDWRQRHQIY